MGRMTDTGVVEAENGGKKGAVQGVGEVLRQT